MDKNIAISKNANDLDIFSLPLTLKKRIFENIMTIPKDIYLKVVCYDFPKFIDEVSENIGTMCLYYKNDPLAEEFKKASKIVKRTVIKEVEIDYNVNVVYNDILKLFSRDHEEYLDEYLSHQAINVLKTRCGSISDIYELFKHLDSASKENTFFQDKDYRCILSLLMDYKIHGVKTYNDIYSKDSSDLEYLSILLKHILSIINRCEPNLSINDDIAQDLGYSIGAIYKNVYSTFQEIPTDNIFITYIRKKIAVSYVNENSIFKINEAIEKSFNLNDIDVLGYLKYRTESVYDSKDENEKKEDLIFTSKDSENFNDPSEIKKIGEKNIKEYLNPKFVNLSLNFDIGSNNLAYIRKEYPDIVFRVIKWYDSIYDEFYSRTSIIFNSEEFVLFTIDHRDEIFGISIFKTDSKKDIIIFEKDDGDKFKLVSDLDEIILNDL